MNAPILCDNIIDRFGHVYDIIMSLLLSFEMLSKTTYQVKVVLTQVPKKPMIFVIVPCQPAFKLAPLDRCAEMLKSSQECMLGLD